MSAEERPAAEKAFDEINEAYKARPGSATGWDSPLRLRSPSGRRVYIPTLGQDSSGVCCTVEMRLSRGEIILRGNCEQVLQDEEICTFYKEAYRKAPIILYMLRDCQSFSLLKHSYVFAYFKRKEHKLGFSLYAHPENLDNNYPDNYPVEKKMDTRISNLS